MRFVAWIIPGLLVPLLFPALPGKLISILFLVLLFLAALYRKCPALMFLLAGVAWTLIHLHDRLDRRLLPGPDEKVIVSGYVSDLPVTRNDMQEFRFRLGEPGTDKLLEGTELLLRWYRDFPPIHAGEFWQLGLRLKPARSRANFYGPDRERWYFAEGISALGIVDPANSRRLGPAGTRNLLAWRQSTRELMKEILVEHRTRPLLLALALADRSEISPAAWTRYRLTGTSHLLAISGMHIGLAAMMGFWIGRVLMALAPAKLALVHGLRIAWGCSIGFAVYYSMMAGLGTSTRRALIMLLTFCIVSLLKRNVAAWQGLVLALALVLLLDPLAPLGAGFWFSFLAVAVLLVVFTSRHGPGHWLTKMVIAQAGLTIVMLPLSMFWFQQVTLLGLASNLVAIPWISFAVVPAILLAVLTMPLDSFLTPFLLFSAAESISLLESFLQWIEQAGQNGWMMTLRPGMLSTVLAVAGGLLLLLPTAVPVWLPGLLLLLPLFLPLRNNKEMLRMEVLDVGQGLAVLVETENHLLLYDTGPGDGRDWSLVRSAIAPAIANKAVTSPHRVNVSHGDLDHAGGLYEIRLRYRDSQLTANLRNPGSDVSHCAVPEEWIWDGAIFTVLHPSIGLPYLGNDSSCVLAISFESQSILMTGDIGAAVEKRLVASEVGEHEFLFAPHHGSKSSSSKVFIKTVKPEFALVSAGYQNQFNFPDPDVKKRFRDQQTPLWNTADCGAIRITLQRGKEAVATSARRSRPAIWRWQPEADCP